MANAERSARLKDDIEKFRWMMGHSSYVELMQPGARKLGESVAGFSPSKPITAEVVSIEHVSPKLNRNLLLIGLQAVTNLIYSLWDAIPFRRRILNAQP